MSLLRVIVTAALVAAAGALTACGAADEGQEQPDAGSVTPGPATSSAGGATISQYASLLASHERKWQEQIETTEGNCRSIDTLVACNLGFTTLSLQAQTIEVVLRGARDNPDANNYLGDPPPEIADLVERTRAAAEAVPDAVDAWLESGCDDPLDSACAAESLALRQALGDVTAELDAWRPYM